MRLLRHKLLATLLALFTLTSAIRLATFTESTTALAKRIPFPLPRGGGGRSSSGGGGRGKSSGSGGSGGGGSVRPPTTRPNSNKGGTTPEGSGVKPHYGGYYLGGSVIPYRAGAPLPVQKPQGKKKKGAKKRRCKNVSRDPELLTGNELNFWSGGAPAWGPFGAYAYDTCDKVEFTNATSKKTETLPSMCLCRAYAECGCAANADAKYIQQVASVGGEDMVQVARVSGQRTLVLNGTLANGTTASGALPSFGKLGGMNGVGWAVVAAGVAVAVACF